MSRPRLALIAPSVGSGMGPLVWATCMALRDAYDICLFVPGHFPFKGEGITIEYLPTARTKMRRAVRMLSPLSHLRIIRGVAAWRPDIVHIFNSEGYPWSVSLSLWARKRIPLVVTIHDPKAHPGAFLAWLNEQLGAMTARAADVIHLFYDAFTASVTQRYRRPVFIVDYVSISHFYLTHRKPDVPRERAVLQFGRLEYYKGVDVLAAAAAFLPPDIKIIIAGAGALDEAAKSAIAQRPGQFEIYERFISDEETAALFQRASVLVLPYREVTQSLLPGIAAEFGVVTVASDIGFFSEHVPRFGGVLTLMGDAKALAEAIKKAMYMNAILPPDATRQAIAERYDTLYRYTREEAATRRRTA
jgi:glycosyltransferase involved in cell wall biosynthesis